MLKSFITFSTLVSILFFSNIANAQEKVKIKDIRKNCIKGSYATCIKLAIKYLVKEPNDFEANYLLGQAYAGRSLEYAVMFDSLEKSHAGISFTEAEYTKELEILKNVYTCSDSASFFYDKSNPLIEEGFIKKNIAACNLGMGNCYNEFSKGTTLELARKYINTDAENSRKSSSGIRKMYDEVAIKLEGLKKK